MCVVTLFVEHGFLCWRVGLVTLCFVQMSVVDAMVIVLCVLLLVVIELFMCLLFDVVVILVVLIVVVELFMCLLFDVVVILVVLIVVVVVVIVVG